MQPTLREKCQIFLTDLSQSVFPDKRKPISAVVKEVTGTDQFRTILPQERLAVIKALESNGYKDANASLNAFEKFSGFKLGS